MIEELEVAGLWSTGSNIDPRLEGGYENVPTIDTHMRQIDWEAHWLRVLATYVRPIQRIVFEGYEDLVGYYIDSTSHAFRAISGRFISP